MKTKNDRRGLLISKHARASLATIFFKLAVGAATCSSMLCSPSGIRHRVGNAAEVAARQPNLHANILQVGQNERLAELFAMVTHRSASLMNLDDYGIRIGNPAEVVVIDARTYAEAVAINAPVLAVFKRGKQTVFRPRAELLRPHSICLRASTDASESVCY